MPFEVRTDLMQAVIDDHYFTYSDSDSDDGDEAPGADWETVPTNLPEAELPTGSYLGSGGGLPSASHLYSTDTTMSTAGGFVSSAAASVASFWRAATGQSDRR